MGHIDSCQELAFKVCNYLSKGVTIFYFYTRAVSSLLIAETKGVE